MIKKLLLKWFGIGKVDFNSEEARQRLRDLGPEVLDQVHKTLTAAGVRYYSDFGTLLGLIRDGGFIKHDSDLDFSLMGDVNPREFCELMVRNGFEFRRGFEFCGMVTEVTFWYKGVPLDFNWHETDGKREWYYLIEPYDRKTQKRGEKQVMRCYRPPVTDLKPLDILGVTTMIPVNYEEFFISQYGPGWKTPDPNWTRGPNDPNREAVYDAFARKFISLPSRSLGGGRK